MTLYSSGKYADLAALAKGCTCGRCDWGCRFALARPCCGACSGTQDADYDRPLTNPANPLIAKFRQFYANNRDRDAVTLSGLIEDFFWRFGSPASTAVVYGVEQSAHARAVLSRLARLENL